MLQEIKFTGINLSDLTLNANSIYLIKSSERENKQGELIKTVKTLEINHVDKTDSLSAVSTLAKVALAEFRAATEIDVEFRTFEGTDIETGIKSLRLLRSYLSNNLVIWKTDSNGKLSKAVISEIPLNKTALNVNEKSGLLKVEKSNLKAAIYQLSKGIIAQTSYLSLVGKQLETIETLCNQSEEQAAATTAKVKANKVKPATTAKVALAS